MRAMTLSEPPHSPAGSCQRRYAEFSAVQLKNTGLQEMTIMEEGLRARVHPFLDVVFGSRPASGNCEPELHCYSSSENCFHWTVFWYNPVNLTQPDITGKSRETYHCTSYTEVQSTAHKTQCSFYENSLWNILSGLRTKKNCDAEHLFF